MEQGYTAVKQGRESSMLGRLTRMTGPTRQRANLRRFARWRVGPVKDGGPPAVRVPSENRAIRITHSRVGLVSYDRRENGRIPRVTPDTGVQTLQIHRWMRYAIRSSR